MNFLLWNFFIILRIFIFKIETAEAIIGGDDARIGQFKYQVALMADNEFNCGAGIINKHYVITAAHCVINEQNKFINAIFKIIAGVINLADTVNSRVEIDVEAIYVPKEFKQTDLKSDSGSRDTGDIAIIKLKSPLVLVSEDPNSMLSELKLPSKADAHGVYLNQKPIIAGFGANSVIEFEDEHGHGFKDTWLEGFKLKFAQSTVISNNKCSLMYDYPVHDKHICAQIIPKNLNPSGVSTGDSGSPLVLNGNMVIGILGSSMDISDERHYAAIYTNVASFLPFIHKSMNGEKSPDARLAVYSKKRKSARFARDMNLIEI